MTKRQIAKIRKIIAMAEGLLASAEASAQAEAKAGAAKRVGKTVRTRRTAAEAAKMRADILAKRAKGVAATTLAEKYGVSTAYIYMIK